METLHPSAIIDSIKTHISVLKTGNNKFFFATQNNKLLSREELFTSDDNQFEFFDIKFGHKRQLYFKDITDIYLISYPEEYAPPMGRDLDENDLFLEISKKYIERINLLDKNLFKYTVDNKKFEVIFNLIRYNEILKYYDINVDFIDKQILFFDEGITDKFLSDYNNKIFDTDGNLKLTLTSAIVLSFFDRETQEYVLEDSDFNSRFNKLKEIYLQFLNISKEKNIAYLETEKEKFIKDLTGIEKNYLIQNFDTEINKIRELDFAKDLTYIDNENDLILYWPFVVDLAVNEYIITTSIEKNKNSGKILISSVANTPFFNLYKVFKEYVKYPVSLKTFEFLKSSKEEEKTKAELIDKKLKIFEKKRDEIFVFLDNELTTATADDIKNDILNLKEEINGAIEIYKKDINIDSSLRDILKYWPVYLYPIPEELVVE